MIKRVQVFEPSAMVEFGKRYTWEGFVIAVLGLVFSLAMAGIAVIASVPKADNPFRQVAEGQALQVLFFVLIIPVLAILNHSLRAVRNHAPYNSSVPDLFVGPILLLVGLFSSSFATAILTLLSDDLAYDPFSFGAIFDLALLITAIGAFLFSTGSLIYGIGAVLVGTKSIINLYRKVEDWYSWILKNPHIEVHRRINRYRKERGMGLYEGYMAVLREGLETAACE